MVTIIEKTVKPAGGGNYTSLQAWITGQAADLPTLNQIRRAVCYSGGNLSNGAELLIWVGGGAKSDATRYYDIVAALGHDHPGHWDTNAAYMEGTASYGIRLHGGWEFVHLTGIQIKGPDNQISLYAPNIGENPASGFVVDRCLLRGGYAFCCDGIGGQTHRFTHSLLFAPPVSGIVVYARGQGTTVELKNCTLVSTSVSNTVLYAYDGTTIDSNNNYLHGTYCYNQAGAGGVINKGANDATSNAEATTVALRNIPFDVTQFVSVTGDLDVHLVPGSTLINAGANLSATVGSYDFEGGPRPFGAAWDIGADEWGSEKPPVCWNYTAKYQGSKRLFKTSGCGTFPRDLRVPGNIDKTTGRMIDDGVEIDPREYEID